MGVTQQGPGAASLPRCGLLMQVHMYDSPSFQPASRKGYEEGTFTASTQNDSKTPPPTPKCSLGCFLGYNYSAVAEQVKQWPHLLHQISCNPCKAGRTRTVRSST